MKLGLTAKALALAVAVGVSSQAMASTVTEWWNIDFENVSAITDLTNETANVFDGIGTWTISEDDESTIVTDEPVQTHYLKLATQGNDLTWTPDAASTASVVLVNADIYLVGSESEPTGFDTDTENPVQSAVYLKNYIDDDTNETTNSVLCAYVAEGESANKWVELSGVSMVDTNWYAIKIEVDYTATIPNARFYVNDIQMVADTTEDFPIANYTDFSTAGLKKVNSVTFRGTGAVDNFVGQQVVPTPAAELIFTVETYTDNVKDGALNAVLIPSGTVTAGTDMKIEFQEIEGFGSGTKYLTAVRVYTSPSAYTDYDATRVGEGDWMLDSPLTWDGNGYTINLIIDTTGMTEGTLIKGYYGEDPLPDVLPPADPTAPAIGGGNIDGADPVAFETIGEVEYFTVTFEAPEVGVVYTLQTAATLGGTFTDSEDGLATKTSTVENEVITLKAPTGGATKMFYRVKASPPEVS